MIELTKVTARDFLCFKDVELNLSKKGLVGILGLNQDAEASDSNGSGKSSVFEAIYFGLYGRLLRQARLDEAVRLGSTRGIYVSVWFEKAGQEYRIERYHKDQNQGGSLFFRRYDLSGPTDLSGENKKGTQQAIQDVIGMSPGLFQHVVLFGQGAMPRFSELGDSEKKELIEEVVGVSLYKRAEKEARRRYNENVSLLSQRRGSLKLLEEQVQLAEERVKDAEMIKVSWGRSRRMKLEYLSREIEKTEKALIELGADAEEALIIEKIKILKQSEEMSENDCKEIEFKKDKMRKAYEQRKEEIITRRSKHEGTKKYLTDKWKRFDELVFDGYCPQCERSVGKTEFDFESIEKQQKSEQDAISRCESEQKELNEAWEEISEDVTSELKGARDRFTASARERTLLEKKLAVLLPQRANLERTLERFKNEHDQEERATFEHTDQLKNAQRGLQTAKERYEGAKTEIDQINALVGRLGVLVNVFGTRGIRSFIFDSMLEELNQNIQRYTDIVSGGSLTVVLRSQSETASGETREKISLDVTNLTGGATYNLSSSGERRRLDLPVSFAFQDVAARRGLGLGVCLLDEVFENLDEEGVSRIVALLNKVSERPYTQTMLVITHHDEMKSWFPKVWQVIKSGGCSDIQEMS